jgi:predicted CopG family antitoxin
MLVKTLTIREDVYRRLVALKRDGESFSELFERLAEQHETSAVLQKLRGLVSFEPEQKQKILEEIYAKRLERRG